MAKFKKSVVERVATRSKTRVSELEKKDTCKLEALSSAVDSLPSTFPLSKSRWRTDIVKDMFRQLAETSCFDKEVMRRIVRYDPNRPPPLQFRRRILFEKLAMKYPKEMSHRNYETMKNQLLLVKRVYSGVKNHFYSVDGAMVDENVGAERIAAFLKKYGEYKEELLAKDQDYMEFKNYLRKFVREHMLQNKIPSIRYAALMLQDRAFFDDICAVERLEVHSDGLRRAVMLVAEMAAAGTPAGSWAQAGSKKSVSIPPDSVGAAIAETNNATVTGTAPGSSAVKLALPGSAHLPPTPEVASSHISSRAILSASKHATAAATLLEAASPASPHFDVPDPERKRRKLAQKRRLLAVDNARRLSALEQIVTDMQGQIAKLAAAQSTVVRGKSGERVVRMSEIMSLFQKGSGLVPK